MTRIKVLRSERYLHNLKTRMPFHYGIARVTFFPHLFLRLVCEIDGRIVEGVAADGLIPKWFTKDPAASYETELADMLNVIETACAFAARLEPFPSVFAGWQQLYRLQADWAAAQRYPPLLWNFGVSLVERAMIDAFCKAEGVSLAHALRRNLLEVELGAIHPELSGYFPAEFLPPEPLRQIAVRHTIGMADYLLEAEIPGEARLADGLPQSLEACLQVYAYRYFKIKVGGNLERDLERISRVAALLEARAAQDYQFTLDGNEQYSSLEQFQSFWNAMLEDGKLEAFLGRLLFVEQPLKRSVALAEGSGQAIQAWEAHPPLIIDESDADLASLRRAVEIGYCGTSHKNCKGIFKGLANACYLEYLRRVQPGSCYFLSGEDLINVGPVALLQDLAMMANLGVRHVERNGQHYFRGLSMFSTELQQETLAHHPDLYHWHEDGFVALRIDSGGLNVSSVMEAPFGWRGQIDWREFQPVQTWDFTSLAAPTQ